MGMEARFERRDGVLIGYVHGRLDAFGAGQLNDRIRESLHDDDRDLIIDLAGCPYLSSGGLRVFLTCKKEMKHRHGRCILSSVMGYPKKVLAVEGFIQVL
jgi:anti-anti-sigma factor